MSTPTTEQLKAVANTIIEAGFPYLKIELEAQFNRESSCDTARHRACAGAGCLECRWTGYGLCPDHSKHLVLNSESALQKLILADLAKAKFKTNYLRFYRDGSCDSEVTATFPTKDLIKAPELIKSFAKIGDLTGSCDIRGAGIHIALMQTSTYPSPRGLNYEKMSNYELQMKHYLPALYFIGAPSGRTRDLTYRMPRIRRGTSRHEDKYSAVYTRADTIMEFRVFEACYDRPELIYDYIATIAKSLQFYSNKITVRPFNHTFSFLRGNSLQRFFFDPKSLTILDKQLALLKPDWKTIDELKTERKFTELEDRIGRRLKVKEERMRQSFETVYEHMSRPSDRSLLDRLLAAGFNECRALSLVSRPKEAYWQLYKQSSSREVVYRLEV